MRSFGAGNALGQRQLGYRINITSLPFVMLWTAPPPAVAAFHFRIRGTPGPRFVRAIRVEATAVLLRR